MDFTSEKKPAPESTEFKPWRCGDPYRYPISEDGDHWQKLLEPKLDEDRVRCESWREEVQNLLIFAGLFSAVVSAFAIVSYPSLKPDQNEIMINLLAHIATRLDNPVNTSLPISEPVSSSSLSSPIPSSSTRVNTFWFISLVLSLTTALIGIVSLQWLREHQQYPNSLTSRQKFALFGMRAEGLEAWYIPQIFSSLPLLLQLALVLFFVGLIDFLFASSATVAIPVILFIGIALSFYIFTTVTPGLQIFVFFLPIARARNVPIQAPYKSSQSRLFRQLLAISKITFSFMAHVSYTLFHLLPSLVFRLSGRHERINKPDAGQQDFTLLEGRALIREIFDTAVSSSWLIFDKKWLELRNAYAESIYSKRWWTLCGPLQAMDPSAPIYDLVNTMVEVVGCYEPRFSTPINLSLSYLCVQDISSHSKSEAPYIQELLHRYDRDLTKPSQTFSSLLWFDDMSVEFRDDETKFIFLSQFHELPPSILLHFAELHIRIANYLYPKEGRKCVQGGKFPSYPDKALWDRYVSARFLSLNDKAISEQFSAFVTNFIKVIGEPRIHTNDEPILTPSYGGRISPFFRFAVWRQQPDGASSTVDFLSRNINLNSRDVLDDSRSDVLFCVAAHYLYVLLQWGCWHRFELDPNDYDKHPVVGPFLALLRQYLEVRGPFSPNLWKHLGIPNPYDVRPERSGFSDFWNLLRGFNGLKQGKIGVSDGEGAVGPNLNHQ